MEILEACDLTGSCRGAAELAGCSHHTVAHYVAAREEGRLTPGRAQPRPMLIDAFLPKVEEWVDRSRGKIRADVVHDRVRALGYAGSERTTRRAVEQVKRDRRAGRRRVHRPWIPSLNLRIDRGLGIHSPLELVVWSRRRSIHVEQRSDPRTDLCEERCGPVRAA
jgi:hypothetical protein